jgi:hypothetical protein
VWRVIRGSLVGVFSKHESLLFTQTGAAPGLLNGKERKVLKAHSQSKRAESSEW